MSGPIRVLQVVTYMDMGGIENFIMNVYRNIDRDKVQFDFLMHRQKPSFFDDEILSMGGRIYRVPAINPLKHHRYVRALKTFFGEHPEYKVVHSHINSYSGFILKQAKRAGVPILISHSHIARKKVDIDLKTPIREYTRLITRKYATHRFACGEDAGLWLYGGNLPFRVLNNGIQSEKYMFNPQIRGEVRQELGLTDGFLIGHVGTLCDRKNQSFIIDVLAELHKDIPRAKAMLIGDGAIRDELIAKVKKLGLENDVILPGIRTDVNRLLMSMDLFVMPSLSEGLPVVLVEAQASGLPCLVSTGVTKESNIVGLVQHMPLDDGSDKWAKWIGDTSSSHNRQEYQRRIVDAGYDIQTTAKYLLKVYSAAYHDGLE